MAASDNLRSEQFEPVWAYGVKGSYHDDSCKCKGHCQNCHEDLPGVREVQTRMIAEGHPGAPDKPLSPRARYCSPYCQGRAKRERHIDRVLGAIDVGPR